MATEIFKRVIISEKAEHVAAQNKYFVEVDVKATKPQIRQAVEKKFGVHVLNVATSNIKGGLRTVRGTRRQIKESTWKRAIVTVKDGERIEQV